jgi:hypothetical protein
MNIFQDPSIIATFVGATVALVSLLLNVMVSLRTQRLAEFLEISKSSLEFKKQQLDELYGILLALNIQNDHLAKRLRDIEGEDFHLLDHLPDILQRKEIEPIVRLFLKNDEKIESLLLTKSSLIEGENFPPSFTLFLKHFGILRSAVEGRPLAEYQQDDYYPKEFSADVERHFKMLKQEVDQLLKQRSRLLGNSKTIFASRK